MGLNFGWRANEVRDSIWIGDEALGEIPAAAREAWREDGDASHLSPFCTKGQPQLIRYRNLSPDETRVVQAFFIDPASSVEGYRRALLMAFRIGVDFDGKTTQKTPEGSEFSIVVKERGTRMLAEPFVRVIDDTYPGMVDFYGKLVLDGSLTTEKEKKASSPPSTPKPSSVEASTAGTTEPPPSAAGA